MTAQTRTEQSPPVTGQPSVELLSRVKRACISAIANRSKPSTRQPWDNPQRRLLRSFFAAEEYVENFQDLLLFAQAEKPTLSADQVTTEFLERQDNGKILRKASLAYARATNVDPKRARHRLLLAVTMHHYGADIMAQLWSGDISPETAEFAASKLKSIPEPSPTKNQEGQAWEPGGYENARNNTHQAKRRLAADLRDLAQRSQSAGDFKAAAASLRDQHHPDPAHQRHARERQKRYVRIRPVRDGMAFLEAYLPVGMAQTIMRGLKATAACLRATGQATGLTHNQLEADIAASLLTGQAFQAPSGSGAGTTSVNDTGHRGTQPTNAISIKPIQPRIFLTLTLQEWVNLGGYLDTRRMGYLKRAYPDLYKQAERNRDFANTDPGTRRTLYPDGVLESGATVTIVGSPQRPSTAESTRLTAQAAMMSVLLTDPVTGYPLGTSKRVRRVSPEVADLVTLRDQTCRYPGCTAPAIDCELDHVDEFSTGGHSSYANSARLCREHHLAKSAGWLTVRPDPARGDGALIFSAAQTGEERFTQPTLPLDPKAWSAYREETEAQNPPPF